jgi:hypothetical protein
LRDVLDNLDDITLGSHNMTPPVQQAFRSGRLGLPSLPGNDTGAGRDSRARTGC